MKIIPLISIFGCLVLNSTNAQVYTNVIVGEKNAEYKDSIQRSEYPYALPIWGAKASALGYDLPYSAGIGINYVAQKSDLIIENLQVGFNGGPLYDLDEVVRFDKAVSTAKIVNLRPDIWLFPFLNVYGILAQAKTSTDIGAGVFIPDSSNVWHQVAHLNAKTDFDASSVGFGLTPTMGVGGGWMAFDMNFVWTDVSALDKPVFTYIFGPRLGKTIRFKKPESNFAFWVGGFRIMFSSQTTGSVAISDIADTDGLQEKVNQGQMSVADKQIEVDAWWSGLSNIEQNNPVNRAKYDTANRALTAAGNLLNSFDSALNDEKSATVQYSLDKKLKDPWNFIVGSQYQFNKHFMIRGEFGFLGTRTQFIGGLQYRFGL